jgi:hypothetical protein
MVTNGIASVSHAVSCSKLCMLNRKSIYLQVVDKYGSAIIISAGPLTVLNGSSKRSRTAAQQVFLTGAPATGGLTN